MNLDNWQTQIRKGLLDIVVLNLLALCPCHGYQIAQTLKKIKALKIREGNIYPILARLQADGAITCYTQSSPDGPPRKYFKLTKKGHEILQLMNEHWQQIAQSVKLIQMGEIK